MKPVEIVGRPEVRFLLSLPRAGGLLAWMWLGLVVLRGLLPVAFVVVLGVVLDDLGAPPDEMPIVALGALFVGMSIAPPLMNEASENLGDRVVGSYNLRLMSALGRPSGIAHLEDPAVAEDVVNARDLDLALSGPPVSVAMTLIAQGISQRLTGLGMAIVLAGYSLWGAAALVIAWLGTNWLLRDTAVWRGRSWSDAMDARRRAEYFYRVAVDPGPAKEVRLFGLAPWVVTEFRTARARLTELRLAATRIRRARLLLAAVGVLAAYVAVLGMLAHSAGTGQVLTGELVTSALAALGTVGIAFSGFNWTISMCGEVTAALERVERACSAVADRSRITTSHGSPPGSGALPLLTREIGLKGVRFRYPGADTDVLGGLDLSIPVGRSLAVVGVNGAGKTTLIKLLTRLYEPTAGHVEVDGVDIRNADAESWRRQVAAVFQDYVRYDLTLRENVAPDGASPVRQAGVRHLG